MTWAIGLIEACDFGREDLDLAAGGRQRVCLRIVTKESEPAAVIRSLRQGQGTARPKFSEARRRQFLLRKRGTCRLVQEFQPLADAATFGELGGSAEPFGKA